MAIVTDRNEVLKIHERYRNCKVPMAVLGTGSFWNTEAVLLAAGRLAKKHGIRDIAVTLSMTFNYDHMPQCPRFTYSGDAETGFEANMKLLDTLCAKPGTPYYDVIVLPHLDHAHPENDKWALTQGVDLLASVMFDAQTYSQDENIKLTAEYVEKYGHSVVVEGIMDELAVQGDTKVCRIVEDDMYACNALYYVEKTGVDFLVADLGTEQQSTGAVEACYMKNRAIKLSEELRDTGLVLHGTSSLGNAEMNGLGNDGIRRVNMWTKIAREAGKFAAYKTLERLPMIEKGEFEATESRQYLYDSVENASMSMENIMEILGYGRLK